MNNLPTCTHVSQIDQKQRASYLVFQLHTAHDVVCYRGEGIHDDDPVVSSVPCVREFREVGFESVFSIATGATFDGHKIIDESHSTEAAERSKFWDPCFTQHMLLDLDAADEAAAFASRGHVGKLSHFIGL